MSSRPPQTVAYFTMEYPRATDTFIQREVASLRDQGMDVVTIAARRPGDEHMVGDEQRAERERTHYLLAQGKAAALAAQARLIVRRPRAWFSALRLAKQTSRPGVGGSLYQLAYFLEAGMLADRALNADGEAVQHLHAHFGDVATSVTMLAAELSGLPYSFTLHGPGVFFDANVWQLGTKIERASFVSCISWFCRSQAQLLSSEAAATKLHIIHCGVDADRYQLQAGQQTQVRVGDDAPIQVAFVARLDHVKGLSILLEAIGLAGNELQEQGFTRPLHLAVIGDGPERAKFERNAAKLGVADQVSFLGYQNQSEVAAVLAQSHMFALPSFAEGVPVSLMEASASAIPVIATNVGGVTELVTDSVTGFVVPPGDVQMLAERIVTLALDENLRRRLGQAGRRQVVEHFNSATEAARLATLFAASIGAPSTAFSSTASSRTASSSTASSSTAGIAVRPPVPSIEPGN